MLEGELEVSSCLCRDLKRSSSDMKSVALPLRYLPTVKLSLFSMETIKTESYSVQFCRALSRVNVELVANFSGTVCVIRGLCDEIPDDGDRTASETSDTNSTVTRLFTRKHISLRSVVVKASYRTLNCITINYKHFAYKSNFVLRYSDFK
jgi:hypothetical protein